MAKELSSYTVKELEAELERRRQLAKANELENWARQKKSPKGVRPRDLIVFYWNEYPDEKNGYRYQLQSMAREFAGKSAPYEYDIYSDWCEVMPDGFNESCENTFEFRGTHEKAKALLVKCGFHIRALNPNMDTAVINEETNRAYIAQDKVAILYELGNPKDDRAWGMAQNIETAWHWIDRKPFVAVTIPIASDEEKDVKQAFKEAKAALATNPTVCWGWAKS